MVRKTFFWLMSSILMMSLFLGGCSNDTENETNGVKEVFSLIPDRDDLVTLFYTDWQKVDPDYSATNLFTNSNLGDRWMWGRDNLEWELELNFAVGGPPVRLFKFSEDFDFSPVSAVYEERGFALEETGDALFFTHDQDMSAVPPIISHANTLIVPAQKLMLITSGGPDLPALINFYAEPEGKRSLADRPLVADLVQELEAEQQIIISWNNCETLTVDDLVKFLEIIRGTELSEQERAVYNDVQSRILAYEQMTIGYHFEDAISVGKIIFSYDSEESAVAELPVRERLADTTTLSLDGIRNDGANLILDVTNPNVEMTLIDWFPARLFSPNVGLFLCP